MKDRNVQFPNRYKLQPVDGTDDIFDVIPAPGEVVEPGDPINKSNLLPDDVVDKLWATPPENPQVKDALDVLSESAKAVDTQVPVDVLGVDWQNASVSAYSAYGWRPLAYGNDVFVILDYNSTSMAMSVKYSTDGENWNDTDLNVSASNTLCSLSFTYGAFYITSASSNSDENVYRSENGINWTNVRNAYYPNYAHAFSQIIGGNNVFVAVPANSYSSNFSNRVLYSENGTNWSSNTSLPFNALWNGITFGNEVFVACFKSLYSGGNVNQVAYSADGITWNASSSIVSTNAQFSNLAFCVDRFYLYGEYGVTKYYFTSVDGMTWEQVTSPAWWPKCDPVLVGDTYFCVGIDNQMYKSTNGTDWELSTDTTFSSSAKWLATNGEVLLINGQPIMISKNTYTTKTRLTTANGTDVTEKFEAALGLPGVQIATGSYVGTGTYGSSNPTTLTFDDPPIVVIIRSATSSGRYGIILINGLTSTGADSLGSSSTSTYSCNISWNGNSVGFYNDNSGTGPSTQMNASGMTYYYAAWFGGVN